MLMQWIYRINDEKKKPTDHFVCSKALQAPSFGRGCVIPISVLFSKKFEQCHKNEPWIGLS